MEICEKAKCTGCFSCVNSCPKNCITMKEDEFGNIYPVIDKDKCIECNLCRKKCPQLNETKFEKNKKTYAMISKDEKIRQSSTSGGAAAVFYNNVIKNGGIAYGVKNIKNNTCVFDRAENLKELELFKGSKYVHAYVNNAYKLVKKDLEDNKEVIFIGTPCQIDGLKVFLGKEYKNLILVDIICHGVPSQKMLRDELKSKNIDNVDNVTFRENKQFRFVVYNSNTKCLDEDWRLNNYYRGFMSCLYYRENCYNCKYARSERVSDISIGDFWGLNTNSKLYNEAYKGISVILLNTDKGQAFFDRCREDMIIEERELKEAVEGNGQLRAPSKKNPYYDKFKKIYIKDGFTIACKKCRTIKQRLQDNKMIFGIYKKMKEGKNG